MQPAFMSDLLVFLFVGVGLTSSIFILLIAERFKRQALRQKQISRQLLGETAWKVLKVSLYSWLAFIFVYFLGYLSGERGYRVGAGSLIFCLLGPLLYALFIMWSYVVFLRGFFRLPFGNSSNQRERQVDALEQHDSATN